MYVYRDSLHKRIILRVHVPTTHLNMQRSNLKSIFWISTARVPGWWYKHLASLRLCDHLDSFSVDGGEWIQALRLIFQPLQGFFNMLIFFYHKVSTEPWPGIMTKELWAIKSNSVLTVMYYPFTYTCQINFWPEKQGGSSQWFWWLHWILN